MVAPIPAPSRHMEASPIMSTKRILPPPAPPIIPMGKHIQYNPISGDYGAFYDRHFLGFRRTRPEAQTLADQHVYELITHGGAE
jgi:hypothetical protein